MTRLQAASTTYGACDTDTGRTDRGCGHWGRGQPDNVDLPQCGLMVAQ